MADLPNLSSSDVTSLLPQATEVAEIGSGGQKRVFRAKIGDTYYALKFVKIPADPDDQIDVAATEIAIRAKREVETMRECRSPFMVKLGPIELAFTEIGDQQILYFSEELIDGMDLRKAIATSGMLPWQTTVQLGLQMADAVSALWDHKKIHRDIKPANIMRRTATDNFVLLDAGFAFDMDGQSLSVGPVGTPAYFSPEQFDYSQRRANLDFRSDIFSLGVTMYECLTGQHPFRVPGGGSAALYGRILDHDPEPPSSLIAGIPHALDDIVLQMLKKAPHLRFRRCSQLLDALKEL